MRKEKLKLPFVSIRRRSVVATEEGTTPTSAKRVSQRHMARKVKNRHPPSLNGTRLFHEVLPSVIARKSKCVFNEIS